MCVGTIVKPQGIRGEVKVMPLTDDPARFYDLSEAFFKGEGGFTPVAVTGARIQDTNVFLTLAGVTDRNGAEQLRGRELYVHRSRAVRLPEGRYFICDLIGLPVTDEKGVPVGRLEEVLQPGANDVYVIQGEREYLVPVIPDAVLDIDLDRGITVASSFLEAEEI
nr:ribosome maturation factor RimM [Gehongia tenuis]